MIARNTMPGSQILSGMNRLFFPYRSLLKVLSLSEIQWWYGNFSHTSPELVPIDLIIHSNSCEDDKLSLPEEEPGGGVGGCRRVVRLWTAAGGCVHAGRRGGTDWLIAFMAITANLKVAQLTTWARISSFLTTYLSRLVTIQTLHTLNWA